MFGSWGVYATNHVCVYILICAFNKFMKSSSCMALDHACHAGKYDCQYSTFSCQAPMEGMRGKLILEVQRQPYNGGKACLDPLVEKECTAPVHCSGIWEKYNCSQRCTTGLTTAYWNHVFRTTQQPKDGSHEKANRCGNQDGDIQAHPWESCTNDLPNCACNGTWSAPSPCTGACDASKDPHGVPQSGRQTRTFSNPVNSSSESLSGFSCPTHGDTQNLTCTLTCPSNCTARWLLEQNSDSCNTTCGQATCWQALSVTPAQPGGYCEQANDIGKRQQIPMDLGACCTGAPAPGLSVAAVAKPDWACQRVEGVTPNNKFCYGTCLDGTSVGMSGDQLVMCDKGKYTFIQGGCSPKGGLACVGICMQ
jgi:hypothetical protein